MASYNVCLDIAGIAMELFHWIKKTPIREEGIGSLPVFRPCFPQYG
jgi:hypothetical protein